MRPELDVLLERLPLLRDAAEAASKEVARRRTEVESIDANFRNGKATTTALQGAVQDFRYAELRRRMEYSRLGAAHIRIGQLERNAYGLAPTEETPHA